MTKATGTHEQQGAESAEPSGASPAAPEMPWAGSGNQAVNRILEGVNAPAARLPRVVRDPADAAVAAGLRDAVRERRVARQQIPTPVATPPQAGGVPTDEELARMLEGQPGIHGAGLLPRLGGLVAAERDFPRSWALMRPRLEARYGAEHLRWAIANDNHILTLARNSDELARRTDELKQQALDRGQRVAYERIWDMAREREFDYGKAMEGHAQAGDLVLPVWEAFLGGSVDERALEIQRAGQAAQEDANERARLAGERTERGRRGLGRHVATREVAFWWDTDISTTELLNPQDGCATAGEALAFARMSGRTSTVLEVERRFYVYDLSAQYTYAEVWEARQFEEHRSAVVPAGGNAVPIVTSDGYVLAPNGERHFGGSQSQRPDEHLGDSLQVLDVHGASLTDEQVVTLFRQVVRDLALVNLRDAERRLNEQLDRLYPGGLMSPEAGGRLQATTATLRRHLLEASGLTATVTATETPNPNDIGRLAETLTAIGRIAHDEPTASLMVADTRDADDRQEETPNGPRAVAARPEDVEDRLAGQQTGDAALTAAGELRRRLANVETVRRHIHAHPEAVLAFRDLHTQVLPRFAPAQQATIERSVLLHDIGELARSLGMGVLDMTLLITGLVAGGPVGMVAAAIGTGMGAVQTAQGFEQASRLAAMAELDVGEGFALATPEEAASARNWAFIGLALTLLDIGGYVRGAARTARLRALLRTPDLASALGRTDRTLAQVARELGMSERALMRELELARGPARDALLARIRSVTGAVPGGGRAGDDFLRMSAEEVERVRRALLERNDIGAVAAALRRGGVNADNEAVQAVKRYLFDSAGLRFSEENLNAWNRLANGRGTVDDARFIVHEMTEIGELRRMRQRTGFDFMGEGVESMPAQQQARWRADFNRNYIEAHAKALEGEYDFIADRVRQATNGRVAPSRTVCAAADPTRAEARLYMQVDGVPLQDHREFYRWAARGREVVEVGAGARVRLRLPAQGEITLAELIEAVKRAPL